MKKYSLFIIALLLGSIISCDKKEQEPSEGNRHPYLENEIVFGAESGNHATRTSYGDASNISANQVLIEWLKNDKIDIAMQWADAPGEDIANPQRGEMYTYNVNEVINTVEGGKKTNSNALLFKLGDKGLQWKGDNIKHVFYGMYPSRTVFDGSSGLGHAGFIRGGVTGFVPVETKVTAQPSQVEPGKYIIQPDMKYAYMSAKTEMVKSASGENFVALNFNPLVSAYQFEFISSANINVRSVSIYSKSGFPLAGKFKFYHNRPETVEIDQNDPDTSPRITLTLDAPLTVRRGESFMATFFALPSVASVPANDLKVQIMFEYNGILFIKTASVNRELKAKKKYFFSAIQMPPMGNATNWFEAVRDNVYINQLSFPTAGNVMSYYYPDDRPSEYPKPEYLREQVKTYEELWNMGVRGFELRTSYREPDQFGSSPFICGTLQLPSEQNFDVAFKKLHSLLEANPKETLVLICTYQSSGHDGAPSGYNPVKYLDGLTLYLQNFAQSVGKDPKDLYFKLTSNTVADQIRGKIAIIVRLSDDELRGDINQGVAPVIPPRLGEYVTVVDNWGTAVDNWDVRFGPEFRREGAFASSTRTQLENSRLMWVVANSDGSSPSQISTPVSVRTNVAYPTGFQPSYLYGLNGHPESAYIQCWERVIPDEKHQKDYKTGKSAGNNYLFTVWPASIQEKFKAIDYLLRKAVSTKGTSSDKLFINCLSGYFPSEELPGSADFYTSISTDSGLNFDQRTGGDYASCSGILNSYMYHKLIGANQDQLGPLGLILFDYIGASDRHFGNLSTEYASYGVSAAQAAEASTRLLEFIILNNFRFPLGYDPDYDPSQDNLNVGPDSDTPIKDGGDAISF